MRTIAGTTLLLIGAAGVVLAGAITVGAPEIDPASGVGAFVLLSGALLVIRGRRS